MDWSQEEGKKSWKAAFSRVFLGATGRHSAIEDNFHKIDRLKGAHQSINRLDRR